MKKSAIIIGAGPGGLLTGAILAQEGLQVTVLEKNAIIGGGLQSFSRFGTLFDTGMHIVGGMQKDGSIRRICEYLGIWDRVRVKDTDREFSDCVFFSEDGRRYRIAQGRKGFVDSLSEVFPDQRDHLIAYVEALFRLAGGVDLFRLRASSEEQSEHSEAFGMSADAFIALYIPDVRLRSVLSYINPLYAGRADVTPAYIHALISVLYISGSSRFAGGSIHFAQALRDVIVSSGGRVLAGAAVTHVHNDGRMISGVSTSDGRTYTADCYVSAIHPCSLFPLLDDPGILPRPYRTRLEGLPNSCSAFTLNVKFRKNSFRYLNHTLYYVSRYDAVWEIGGEGAWPQGFVCVTPPVIGQGEFAEKLIVTAPMPWSCVKAWEDSAPGCREESYQAWKADCANKLLSCLEEMFPGFRTCVEAVNTASPLTIRDYYGSKEGSMYGFSKDCRNLMWSLLPVVTKVPNLFLTGQNCMLHGLCGVSLTAVSTCEAILGRGAVLNRINRFDDIRPYYDFEIPDAMRRIAADPALAGVSAFLYPGEDVQRLRERIGKVETTEEFQLEVMNPAISRIVENTCDSFTCEGLEELSRGENYVFVSNHRDIMLDASLLSKALYADGFDTPEITFGANLMKGGFVIDVGKANKMFRVERPGGDIRAFYRLSEHLSDYIRTAVCRRGQSVWIAQRNGRTKDGKDRTDQGIIKMFAMSGGKDKVRALADLHIVPVAISYEWEPCDLLKAAEIFKRAAGPYQKYPGEDLNSILTGIMQRKGRIRIAICRQISEADIRSFEGQSANGFYKSVASLVDERICSAYHLFPNNYIAHDMASGETRFLSYYSREEKAAFEAHLAGLLDKTAPESREVVRRLILDIYATPVDSKYLFRAR